MRKRITIIILILALWSSVSAQSGAIDPTFNKVDHGFGAGDGANGFVYASAIQNNGKIIIGGEFTYYNGTARSFIARLNTDGSLDASFNPGIGPLGSMITTVNTIAIQSDGKIVIAGYFTSYNGTGINNIARLNTDGTLDTTFLAVAGENCDIRTIAIQSDGKIVIAGYFSSYDSTYYGNINRLNTDGTIDTTFHSGNMSNWGISSVAIQSNGQIIIAGGFSSYDGTAISHIARLNLDGSLDTTFDPGTGPGSITSSTVHNIVIQNNGKIIIGGKFTNFDGTSRNGIARLNTDGSLDTSFDPGTGIAGGQEDIWSLTIQNDGKIIITGGFTSFNGIDQSHIARLNTDGSLDVSFNHGTGAEGYYVLTSALLGNGKIIVGGDFRFYNGTPRGNIVCLNTDGTLDTSFDPGRGANNKVYTTAIQSNGKIIIGGEFSSFNGTARIRICRLNTDGSLDATFDTGTGTDRYVTTTAIQNDGKIIIGGSFRKYNGTPVQSIARLNLDGSLDSTFNQSSGPGNISSSGVLTTSIQNDGKIIIGGPLTSYNGTPMQKLARLNADGTLDSTFDPGTGPSSTEYCTVFTSTIQSDGKIIIGGGFTHYNGTDRNNIARVNTDGSLDTLFDPGTGPNDRVLTIAIQSDEKIIIGGNFTEYNGTVRNRLTRLNTDGSLDTSFDTGTGANDCIRTCAIQSDGKIIIGGEFTDYNGTTINNIARLNEDGSLDVSFNPGIGTGGTTYPGISTTAIQNDGKIIIGGDFTSYNGTGRNRVARLLQFPLGIPSPQFEDQITAYPVPFSDELIIEKEGNNENVKFEILNTLGQMVFSGNIINRTSVQTSNFTPGVYFIKLEKGKSFKVMRLIKQ